MFSDVFVAVVLLSSLILFLTDVENKYLHDSLQMLWGSNSFRSECDYYVQLTLHVFGTEGN